MKYLRVSILAAVSIMSMAGITLAHAADGLGMTAELSQTAWPRLQGRLQLNTVDMSPARYGETSASGSRLLSASLLGDYYLTGSWLGQRSSGGLRATSGLLMGPMSLTLSGTSLGARNGMSLNHQSFSLWSVASDSSDYSTTLPYIGIGYTGQSTRGTWGFKADFGLIGVGSSGGLRLGNSSNPLQGLDETLRDMRFKPVIQLGMSYAF